MDKLDNILFYLAIILFATKLLGLIFRRVGLPQVIGYLVAGLLLGGAIYSLFNDSFRGIINVDTEAYQILKVFAEIGVILLMFTAGLETNIDELKKVGFKAGIVAFGGVIVPLIIGFLIAIPFKTSGYGLLSCLFIGAISTATSVGITVETLKELNVINGRVATTIVSAAIMDDIIGIILLSVLIGVSDGSGNILSILLKIVLFFVFAIAVAFIIYFLGKRVVKKYPHNKRLSIFSLAICFFYAWAAEVLFGVADITGAFVAGIVVAITLKSFKNQNGMDPSIYVDKKVETSNSTIFAPIFFANIGIQISFKGLDFSILLFGLLFILTGILSKLIGCGLSSFLLGYSKDESAKIGVGMLARGEVALIVALKGVEANLMPSSYMAITVLLILVTSIISPIILKGLYKHHQEIIYEDEITD